MKILLIGNYDKDHQFSMQKFTDCLADNLIKHGHNVKVCKPRSIAAFGFSSTVLGLGKWLGYIDKYLLFPFILKKQARWADIIHICDHSNSIYVPYIKKFPHLVTCHDLMAVRSSLGEFKENNQIGKSGQLQQKWIIKGLRSANAIASVSNATQTDLKRFIGGDTDHLRVIYNGLNYPFKALPLKETRSLLNKYSIDQNSPFLLHIGGNQWYKNRLGLINIYHDLIIQEPNTPLNLILVGKPFTQDLRDLITRYQLDNRVIEIVGATTEELMAFYSLAEAFIFPSLYEGFGWPIIEALACNTLVFTSDRQPMNEIGGDAVIYFNLNNTKHAAEIILKTLHTPRLIKDLKTKTPAIVEKFSTEKMIQNYITFYEFILKQNNQ